MWQQLLAIMILEVLNKIKNICKQKKLKSYKIRILKIKINLQDPNSDMVVNYTLSDGKINGIKKMLLQKYRSKNIKQVMICPLCGYEFSQNKMLLNHLKTMHTQLSQKQDEIIIVRAKLFHYSFVITKTKTEETDYWRCPCRQELKTRNEFIDHVIEVHNEVSMKNYNDHICY